MPAISARSFTRIRVARVARRAQLQRDPERPLWRRASARRTVRPGFSVTVVRAPRQRTVRPASTAAASPSLRACLRETTARSVAARDAWQRTVTRSEPARSRRSVVCPRRAARDSAAHGSGSGAGSLPGGGGGGEPCTAATVNVSCCARSALPAASTDANSSVWAPAPETVSGARVGRPGTAVEAVLGDWTPDPRRRGASSTPGQRTRRTGPAPSSVAVVTGAVASTWIVDRLVGGRDVARGVGRPVAHLVGAVGLERRPGPRRRASCRRRSSTRSARDARSAAVEPVEGELTAPVVPRRRRPGGPGSASASTVGAVPSILTAHATAATRGCPPGRASGTGPCGAVGVDGERSPAVRSQAPPSIAVLGRRRPASRRPRPARRA